MIRCNVCGRSLVGLRADHPVLCRIETGFRSSRPSRVEIVATTTETARITATGRNPRIIHEGDFLDPLVSDEERQLVIEEGPAQRGTLRDPSIRFAS